MHYEGSFEVPSPRVEAYAFITNPEKLTTIFPDVENVKMIDDANISLKAKVGISFMKGTLDVKMTIVEKKEPEFAKLRARGNGIGSYVDLQSNFQLEQSPSGGSLIRWAADAKVSGLLASVGARVMDEAAQKYVKLIVDSLKTKLSRP